MDHETATTNQAVERYLLDELTGPERDEFEEHFFSCAECAEAMESGTSLVVNGRAVAKELSRYPSLPGRVTAIRPRPGSVTQIAGPIFASVQGWARSIAAAAAVVLVVTTGYQNFVTIPELKSPRAVTRTLLRPQSRGTIPTVQRTPGADEVLSLELNASHPRDAYDVDVLKSGQTLYRVPNVPVQDGALEVIVPAGLRPGSYEMLVRVPGNGSEVGRYPFQM